MPPISVLIKPASGMCNIACTYCFYRDEMENRQMASCGFMTEESLKNLMRRTLPRAEYTASYAFQGGEPTLRGVEFFKKVLEYEKKYNKRGVNIQNSLQTNGLLLNDDWCEFLKENHFLVGVSVDGIQKTHDLYRLDQGQKGTYDKVLKGISLLEKYKVDFNILTVVNKDVAENIKEIYRDYKKRGWNYQQYIVCMEPLKSDVTSESYALSPIQYGTFLIQLFDSWYADYKQGCQPYIRQFENYIRILAGYYPEACDQRGTCSLQTVVEADGSVYPCDFYALDGYCLGNFNENTLPEIYQNLVESRFIEKSHNLSGKCKACPYYGLCRCACQRNRIMEKDGYCSYFCEGYKMFFDHAKDKLKEIAEKIR